MRQTIVQGMALLLFIFCGAPVRAADSAFRAVQQEYTALAALLPSHFATAAQVAPLAGVVQGLQDNLAALNQLANSGDAYAVKVLTAFSQVLGSRISSSLLALKTAVAECVQALTDGFTAYQASLGAACRVADVYCVQMYEDVLGLLTQLPPTLAQQATEAAPVLEEVTAHITAQLACLREVTTVSFSSQPEAEALFALLDAATSSLAAMKCLAIANQDARAIALLVAVASALGDTVERTRLATLENVEELAAALRNAAAALLGALNAPGAVIQMADVYCSQAYRSLNAVFVKLPLLFQSAAENAASLAAQLKLQMTAFSVLVDTKFVAHAEAAAVKTALSTITTAAEALQALAAGKDAYAASLLFNIVTAVGTDIVATQLASSASRDAFVQRIGAARTSYQESLAQAGTVVRVADTHCSAIYTALAAISAALPVLVQDSLDSVTQNRTHIDREVGLWSTLVTELYANQAEVAVVQELLGDGVRYVGSLADLAMANDAYAAALIQDLATALGNEVSRTGLSTVANVQSFSGRLADAATAYQQSISAPGVLIGMADVYCSQIYNAFTNAAHNLVGMARVQPVANARRPWLSKKALIAGGAIAGSLALLSLVAYGAVVHYRHAQKRLETPLTQPLSPDSFTPDNEDSASVNIAQSAPLLLPRSDDHESRAKTPESFASVHSLPPLPHSPSSSSSPVSRGEEKEGEGAHQMFLVDSASDNTEHSASLLLPRSDEPESRAKTPERSASVHSLPPLPLSPSSPTLPASLDEEKEGGQMGIEDRQKVELLNLSSHTFQNYSFLPLSSVPTAEQVLLPPPAAAAGSVTETQLDDAHPDDVSIPESVSYNPEECLAAEAQPQTEAGSSGIVNMLR